MADVGALVTSAQSLCASDAGLKELQTLLEANKDGLVEQTESCLAALSVYGLADGAVRQSSTITLLDPNVKDVDATWEGRAFKFRLVRVDLPNQILVGGSMPVGLARPRLASINL